MSLVSLGRLDDEQLEKLESDLAFIVDKHNAENSLFEFFKQGWHVLETSELETNWHHQLFCERFECLIESDRRETNNDNVPPRTLKSLIYSVYGPVWSWINTPHLKYIFSSNGASLSTSLSIKRRDLIQSTWFQARWGDRFKLKADRNTQDRYANDKNGEMISTSVGGSIIGEGADIIINDDPLNPKDAYSEAAVKLSVTHHKNTLMSRFNDKRKAKVLHVAQRLHEHDLGGELSEKKGTNNLIIPIQNKTKKTLTFKFPKSGKVVKMKPNQYLSKRMGKKEIDELYEDTTIDQVEAQYFQNPSSAGSSLLGEEHINHWTTLPKGLRIYLSIDCTFKGDKKGSKNAASAGKKTDKVALHAWGVSNAQKYLVGRLSGKWGISKTIEMMAVFANRYAGYVEFLVEDKANGPAIIDLMGESIPRLVPYSPGQSSKLERFVAIIPDFEAGNILLPPKQSYPYVEKELIPMFTKFPKVGVLGDDDIDAMSQAVTRIKSKEKKNLAHLVKGLQQLNRQ